MIMKMNYKILLILLMLMLLTPKKMVRIFLLTYTELSESDLHAFIDALPVSLNPNENGKNIFANRYRITGK
jgi:hypothetical protein